MDWRSGGVNTRRTLSDMRIRRRLDCLHLTPRLEATDRERCCDAPHTDGGRNIRLREGAHRNTVKHVTSEPSPARATSFIVRLPLRYNSQPTHLALPMIGSMPTRSPMAFAVLDDGLTGRLLVGVAHLLVGVHGTRTLLMDLDN